MLKKILQKSIIEGRMNNTQGSVSFLVVLGKVQFFECTEFSNEGLVLALQYCNSVF